MLNVFGKVKLVPRTRFSIRFSFIFLNELVFVKSYSWVYFESSFNELQSKQLRCLMIIKAVHVGGNYIHFHAAFSLLCLLPTKEIISGSGKEAQCKT